MISIISTISSLVLGVINSIKYGSTEYAIPYIVIALIAILIDCILLIKNQK
jgi:hypothetical protein